MQRPFKIPLRDWLLVGFVTFPIILCLFTFFLPIAISIKNGDYSIPITTILILIAGGGSFPLIHFIRRKWSQYERELEGMVGLTEFSADNFNPQQQQQQQQQQEDNSVDNPQDILLEPSSSSTI